MIFGTEVRIISQTYSEATQLMPTITWAKKSSSKSTYIGTINKLKISTPFEVLVVIRLKISANVGRFGRACQLLSPKGVLNRQDSTGPI